MRVADYIFNHLESIGVTHVFGLSGGLSMWLFNSLGQSKIKYVAHHHEQAASFAADAYARQSGKLGVALLTGGPGGLNAICGIVGAYQDSIPVLFIVGQCKTASTLAHKYEVRKSLGRDIRDDSDPQNRQVGTFEVDLIPIVESVSKRAVTLSGTVQLKNGLLDSMLNDAMTGRPGPVVLEVPLDVQGAEYAE